MMHALNGPLCFAANLRVLMAVGCPARIAGWVRVPCLRSGYRHDVATAEAFESES